jgi:DNA-binding transcriptional LysR family regulator
MFNETSFDAAIHFGSSLWPGAVTRYLFGEELTTVCSPALLGGRQALPLSAVEEFGLLHLSARPDAWRQWLSQAGLHQVDAMKGQRYELFSMLVEAARAGLGVALVPSFLVMREIESGELVKPFELALPGDSGYYFVYPENSQNTPVLHAFEEWLLRAARAYVASIS